MKKNSFLFFTLLIITLVTLSFTLISKNTHPNLGLVQKSLNNIDSSTAQAMIAKFNSLHSADKTPQVCSYWIPKATLHNIVSILNKEKQGKTGIGATDGIRIYFAYDLAANSGNLINRIILVATHDNGVFSGSTRKHKDYYYHNASDPLFSMSNYGSTFIGNSTNSVPGALLFEVCSNCVDNPNCPPSSHSISRASAETMVHNFYQHPHPIQNYSEWFDLNLLNYLDNDLTSSGIRIYIASSNTSSSWLIPSSTISDRFILTETSIDPITKANTDNFSCSTTTAITSLATTASGTGNGSSGTPPQDEGELCPQNCPN